MGRGEESTGYGSVRQLYSLQSSQWLLMALSTCLRSSWTEDTRAQIFSESVSAHGLPETQWEELERKIEGKFKEFEELASTGQTLVSEEHYLSETVSRRWTGGCFVSSPLKTLGAQPLAWYRADGTCWVIREVSPQHSAQPNHSLMGAQ